MSSQVVYKRSKMGIRNILLMNWAPLHIIFNNPVKKPTNKTKESYILSSY